MNDIICFEIVDINISGIILKNKNIFICFDDCAKNYANEKSLKKSKCIATRDITNLTFIFYTKPKTKVVLKKHFLRDIFMLKNHSFTIK